jgi:transposase-like protein
MVSFKGAHFVKDIILTCVRWYMAYPLGSVLHVMLCSRFHVTVG